jgi:hypothetical protein
VPARMTCSGFRAHSSPCNRQQGSKSCQADNHQAARQHRMMQPTHETAQHRLNREGRGRTMQLSRCCGKHTYQIVTTGFEHSPAGCTRSASCAPARGSAHHQATAPSHHPRHHRHRWQLWSRAPLTCPTAALELHAHKFSQGQVQQSMAAFKLCSRPWLC